MHPRIASQQTRYEEAMSKPVRYFELWDDMLFPDRWVLRQVNVDDGGRRLDPWQFTNGTTVYMENKPVLSINHPGVPLDFSLTGLATPVVSERVVSLFERLGLEREVQLIPAQVEGQETPYFILNVLRIIRCINDSRCEEVRYWTPEDGDPEMVGKYMNVRGLKVDPSSLVGTSICRPLGWEGAIIVTDRIKQAMEHEGITGTLFSEA
jgi:hypothetical protein